jgi:uncharacterized protein (DUF1330 family)
LEFNPNLVAWLIEFDMPKENLDAYNKTMSKSAKEFANWQKEGIIKEYHSWGDNTGHYIIFVLFESIDKYAELWNQPNYHDVVSEGAAVAENARMRLLRPAAAPE